MQKTPSKKRKITDLSNQKLNKFFYNDDMIDSTSLILDNNRITEFSFKFVNWKSLKKLSVASNGLTKINQIEDLLMLNVLDLKGNQIKKIEGLSSFLHLEWLCLSSNNIKVIENLRANILLCYLDLSDNCIEDLGDLSFLIHLKVLLLHTNKVRSLKSLAKYLPPSIHTLTMADNNLQDLTEVQLFASLPFLEDLTLFGNPFACSYDGQYVDYKLYAISCCKNLQTLDGSPITQAEKHSANVFEAEGHLKMLQPGQHLQLSNYLLEASPGYSPKFSQIPQMSKAKEKSHSTGVNTSLLESESIHLPLICDSPPKSKNSSSEEHRPFTAPPTYFNREVKPWQALMSSKIQSSITEGEDKALNCTEESGILTPLPSASSPSRSLEFERTLQIFEGHGSPKGAIEITNEVVENDSKFRARFRVEEARMNPTSSPDRIVSQRMEKGFLIMDGRDKMHGSYIELPSENASVSLTADEAASLLHLAAAMIQAYVRGFLQRRRYQKYLRRHKAAVKIQAVWRGYFARNSDVKVVNIRNELKVQKLNSRVFLLESKISRGRAERKKDKGFIADAIRILLQEINLQREKLDRIEIARQREEDAKTELYEICLGLQNEICRLRSAIESGGELLRKNGFDNREDFSLIAAACEKQRGGKINAGLSQTQMTTEKTPSGKVKAIPSTNADPTLRTFSKGAKHSHPNVTRKLAEKGDRLNFAEKSAGKTQCLQSNKVNSSVGELTRKDTFMSSRKEGRNSASKSNEMNGFSFESFTSGVFREGLDVGCLDEKEYKTHEMEGNIDEGKNVSKEGQVPALYETFDLGNKGSKFANAVEVLNDDFILKTSPDANRDGHDCLSERYDEGKSYCRNGFDRLAIASGKLELYSGTVPTLIVRSEKMEDVEDRRGQVEGVGPRSEVISHGAKEEKMEDVEDRRGQVEGVGPRSEVISHGAKELDIAVQEDGGSNYLETLANGSNLELQKEYVEDTGGFSDNMDAVIEVDEIRQKNSILCDIHQVEDSVSKTAGQNEIVEKLSAVAVKAKEACHLNEPVRKVLMSSNKGIEKDHVGSKDGCFPDYKYGLFSEGSLSKSSTIGNAKRRRRTLFPKVLPEENDTDTPKAKVNLSADAQSTRAMFFSPLSRPSEAHVSESDGIREASDLLKVKEHNRMAGNEDVMVEEEFLGRKHIERRELYCQNREAHCDGGIRSVYREVSAYHGGLISGKQKKSDGAFLEGTNSEGNSQEMGIGDNQPLSGNVIEVSDQVVANQTAETEQPNAGKFTKKAFSCDQAKAENAHSAISRTEKVPDIAQTSTNHEQVSLSQYRSKGNVLHEESGNDPNPKLLSVAEPESYNVANDVRAQRKPETIPSIENDRAKETIDNINNGKRNYAENSCTEYAEKATEGSAVHETDGETFDNDTIIAVEDAVLRNTRTSTPIKDPDGSENVQLCAEQKDATKGIHVARVKRDLSTRLNDMPDCINSMPQIVPMEQRNKETTHGLPMFIDQSFESVDNNCT